MDLMTISGESGGYTFWRNPKRYTIPKEEKYSAVVKTYTGVAFFSWGTEIAGQRVILEWDQTTAAMFNQFQTFLEDDSEITWDPQDGNTYTCEILRLDGVYVEHALLDAEYREEVKLELLVKAKN